MMNRIRSRLSYANVVATLALFLVLSGGTAVALTGSNTVFTDDIVNDEVKSADVRNDDLTNGGLGAVDLRAGSVRGPEVLDNSLGGADVNESSLGIVPDAAHATNSDQLGGLAASEFQRRAVFPISEAFSNPLSGAQGFGSSELRLFEECGPNSARVRFINSGDGGATLNWTFSQGGTTSTVNASGTSLNPSGQQGNVLDFVFTNRLEGQWIFADGAGVTTVHLHAFISPGSPPRFCEFQGTALWAPNA